MVWNEPTTDELAVNKLAARERRSSENTIFKRAGYNDSTIEMRPVQIHRGKLAANVDGSDERPLVLECFERAKPVHTMIGVLKSRSIGGERLIFDHIGHDAQRRKLPDEDKPS